MAYINLFNEILLVCMLIAAIFIIVSDNVIREIIALSMFGIFTALDCILLKANLVALTEVVVGAVFIPLFFIITFTKMNKTIENENSSKMNRFGRMLHKDVDAISKEKRGEND